MTIKLVVPVLCLLVSLHLTTSLPVQFRPRRQTSGDDVKPSVKSGQLPPALTTYPDFPQNLLPLEAASSEQPIITPNQLPLWNAQVKVAHQDGKQDETATKGQLWTNQVNHGVYQPTYWPQSGHYIAAPQLAQYVWQWPQQQMHAVTHHQSSAWPNGGHLWTAPQYYSGHHVAHWPQAVVTGFTYVIGHPSGQPEVKPTVVVATGGEEGKEGTEAPETSESPKPVDPVTPPTMDPDAMVFDKLESGEKPDTADKMVMGDEDGRDLSADESSGKLMAENSAEAPEPEAVESNEPEDVLDEDSKRR